MSETLLGKYHRNSEIAALLSSGTMTLEDVGKAYGITRERARQIAVNLGVSQRSTGGADPIAIIRVIRSRPDCTSWRATQRISGASSYSIIGAVSALGLLPAVVRLFRARISRKRRQRIACLVDRYQRESNRAGRPLSSREIIALGAGRILGKGYVNKLRRLVGESVRSGSPAYSRGLRRGDLTATILALAATPQGVSVPRVLARIPTSDKSVGVALSRLAREGKLACVTRGHRTRGLSVYRLAASPSPDLSHG